MASYNGDSYVDFKNINLRGGASGPGLIRWDPASLYGSSGALWGANPFGATDYGLYINASGQLVFSAANTTTIIGAAGAASTPTWNTVWGAAQSLQLAGVSTFTIDNNTGNNNVLTLTNTGTGSGVLLQITNAGTGSDIAGTSGTWTISKLGAITGKSLVLAGTAGTTSLTMTLGDIITSAGGLSLTKAANNATLTVTNNTSTSASAIVFAGSGTYTGNTTSSWMTLTPSGLTTGTAVYLITTALVSGKALQVVYDGTTSQTTGIQAQILNSSTAMQASARIFSVSHTGVSSSSGAGILSEFASAAADGTDILKVTASSTLTGNALWVSAGSMATGTGLLMTLTGVTTGTGISMTGMAALTTGVGINMSHTTSVIADTGSMLRLASTGINTGGATNGTMLDIQTTLQVAGTQVLIKAGAVTTGVLLSLISTTALTSGSLLRATTSTAGALATNGAISLTATGNFTSNAVNDGGFVEIKANSTTAGTIVNLVGSALTTGVGMIISNGTSGITTGSLLRVSASGTGAVSSNGVVNFIHAGIFTSTTVGFVNVTASAAIAGTVMSVSNTVTGQTTGIVFRVDQTTTTTGFSGAVAQITGSHTTGGTTLSVVDVTTSAGDGVLITSNALVTGSSTAMRISHTTSVLGAGNSLLRISSTSTDTGTTTGTLLDLASAATTGIAQLITASALTSGVALSIITSGASQTSAKGLLVTQTTTTTGFTGSVASFVGSFNGAGGGNVIGVTAVNTTVGDGILVTNNAITTGGSTLVNLSHSVASAIGNGSSMLRITSAGVDTGTTTGNLLDLASSASTAGTLVLLTAAALATGTGVSLALAGITTGTGLLISATAATMTGAGRYFACYDGAVNAFSIGPNGHIHSVQSAIPTIATNATGISAVALTAGATDTCGQITTTGTPQSGTVLTFTFNKTYTNAPKAVIITPINANAGNPNTVPYVTISSATQWTLTWPAAGTYAATPSYCYAVIA